MSKRKHKKVDTDLYLYAELIHNDTIIFGHPSSDSWLRADADDGFVMIGSSDNGREAATRCRWTGASHRLADRTLE